MTHVLLALGNFHRWLYSNSDTEFMSATIESMLDRGLIDGFEVGYSLHDLVGKGSLLPERFKDLPVHLQSRIIASLHSIHLPSLGNLKEDEKLLLAHRVRHAYETGLCCEFTIHPDNTSFQDWRMFLQTMPDGSIISVENMDREKQNYKTLSELKLLMDLFPQLHITFDICHWLELGHPSDCRDLLELFEDYHGRISKVHFSAPSSSASWYSPAQGMQDNHNLVSNSGWNISPDFYGALSNVPFVMEGGIPLGCIEAIVGEVELIRQNTTRTSTFRERTKRAA